MSLLPMAIVDALAGKIARTITPTLQSALRDITDHKPIGNSGPSLFQRLTAPILGGGSSNGGGSSSPAPAKLPTAISRIMNPPLEKSVVNKFIAAAEKRSAIDQQKSGQSFWKRGWGTLQNGQKRSTASRAARLTTIAQRRLSTAKKAVSASNKNRNSPGWHPAAHGQLLANKNAAAQKLAQATAIQAKSTFAGALSSGRVAIGLSNLASKIPMLAARLALPAAIVTAAVRAPFQLAKMNDARLETLRESARYSSRIQAAFAKYDVKTENIKALNARDTAGSTEFLIDQQNKLRTTLRPFQAAAGTIINSAQGGITWALRKGIESQQAELDLIAAGIRSGQDALQGKVPNPGKHLVDIANERLKAAAGDEKVQSQEFSNVFKAFSEGIVPQQQNGLANARFNNVTIPPLRKIR